MSGSIQISLERLFKFHQIRHTYLQKFDFFKSKTRFQKMYRIDSHICRNLHKKLGTENNKAVEIINQKWNRTNWRHKCLFTYTIKFE